MTDTLCPICEQHASIEQMGDACRIRCDRCGQFKMVGTLLSIMAKGALSGEDRDLLRYVSAHTRQATEGGIHIELDSRNWREFARAHKSTPILRKVSMLLELVATRSPYPGGFASFDRQLDYPLVDAGSTEEMFYLLKYLMDIGFLLAGPVYNKESYCLTIKGWERLEAPARGGIPGHCFIAMSFHPSLDQAYELGIKPAVRDCGFEPIRIDLVHHNEKICDKILAEIGRSQFMVADFTGQRAGVYFEAGFGMGLGRPVIWMCRKDDFENTHFDTRQYNHIVWTTPDDLKARLTDRIRATISGQVRP